MQARTQARASGWVTFAGIMILLVGAFNFIDGIVAIVNSHYYAYYYTVNGSQTATVHHLVFGSSIAAWGWAMLIGGVIEALVALAILAGQSWAAVVGIIVATLNAIGQLMMIGIYPWWSVIAIAVDVLVIYGLAVYGFGAPAEA